MSVNGFNKSEITIDTLQSETVNSAVTQIVSQWNP